MIVDTLSILHIIIALTVVLFVSHLTGYFFQYYRQPRVIGEIIAGLFLGPTLLQHFLPQTYEFIFNSDGPTKTLLNIIYQLGLLHLMFQAGMELRSRVKKREKQASVATWIAVLGTGIPFAASFLFLKFIDINKYLGTAENTAAFILVFSIAVAITSIPVISRILHDLKILNTSFSKIILSAAVFEDIILYVVLTVALGMVGTTYAGSFGLSELLGISDSQSAKIIYHICITIIFFAVSLLAGPPLFRWFNRVKFNFFQTINPLAFLISFMLLMSGIALLLDITPMFGAFVGGIIAQSFRDDHEKTSHAYEQYSFAFFIPIYFAMVGIKLDLIHAFDPLFFVLFMTAACFVKWGSVYVGARIAKESPRGAVNLAVAMNARGGPGIVLASLAFDARIINEPFYTVLVMLAIVTSFLAGSWLDYVVRKKIPLR